MNEKLSEMSKRAYEARVEGQLASGYAIQWPGTQFKTGDYTEWIQPLWFGFTSIPTNGSTKVRAQTAQINCFARMGEAVGETNETSTNRIHEIVDEVIDVFRYQEVAVEDIDQAGDPQVATLTFLRPNTDDVPAEHQPGGEGDAIAVTLPAILENF